MSLNLTARSSDSEDSEDEHTGNGKKRVDHATESTIREPADLPDGGTAPGLTSYNLSKAVTPEWSELEAQPPSKAFVAMKKGRVKGGIPKKFIMRFTKENYGGIFKNIAQKFNIKPRKLQIQYPIRKSNNSVDTITIMHAEEDQLREELHMFYCTTEDMSEIVVREVANPKRVPRPNEVTHSKSKKHFVIDRKYYESFITATVASDFIQKRNLVRAVMGSITCCNLVNPSLFYCHIPGCHKPEVNLRSTSGMTDFVNHLKKHDYKDVPSLYRYDASASVVLRRHQRLVELKAKLTLDSDVVEAIDTLNQDEELEVDILMANKMFLYRESQICQDRQVDEDIMKKLAVNDPSALSSLPPITESSSFFNPGTSRKNRDRRATGDSGSSEGSCADN